MNNIKNTFLVGLLISSCHSLEHDNDNTPIGYLYKLRVYDFQSTTYFTDLFNTSKPIKTHANVSIKYVHSDKDSMLSEYTINNCFRGPCRKLDDNKVYVELERGQVVNGLLQDSKSLWDFRHSLVYSLTVPHLEEVGKRERGLFPHGNCDFVHKRYSATEYVHEIKRCDFNFFNPANPLLRFTLNTKINYFQNEKYVGEETEINGVETFEFRNVFDSRYFLNVTSTFTFTLKHTEQRMTKKICDTQLTVRQCADQTQLWRVGKDWGAITTSLKAVNSTNFKKIGGISKEEAVQAVDLLCSTDQEEFERGYRRLEGFTEYTRPMVYKLLNVFYGFCTNELSTESSLKVAELLVKGMIDQPLIATYLLRAESQALHKPNEWGYLYDLIDIESRRFEDFDEFWRKMRRFHVFRPNYLYLSQHGKAFAKRKRLAVLADSGLFIITKFYNDNHYTYELEVADHRNVTELTSVECKRNQCQLRVINHKDDFILQDDKILPITIGLNTTMPLQSGPALLFGSTTKLLLKAHREDDLLEIEFELQISDRITAVKTLFDKKMKITGKIQLTPQVVVVQKLKKMFFDGTKEWRRRMPGITIT